MKSFVKWALLILVINVILSILGYVTMDEDAMMAGDQGIGQIFYYLGMVAGIVCLFLGIREKKMSNPSEFTFGKGFGEGMLISVVAGLFVGIFIFFFYSYVAPEVMDVIRESSYANMTTQGMTTEQIDQARPMMDFFISPSGFLISTLFMYILGGAILSLIMAAIVNATGPKSGGNDPLPN